MSESTLIDWMKEWVAVYKIPMVKHETGKMYEYAISIVERFPLSRKPVGVITEIELQTLLNALAVQRYSKSTIEKVRLSLRQAYKVLFKNGLIHANPTVDLKLPLAPTKEVLPLTHQQQKMVKAVCETDPLGHLIIFLMETGLRRNEMKNLKWVDYNTDDHSVMITQSKTPAGIRKVYLTSCAENIILSQDKHNGYIFNHTKGAPITKSVMRRLVDRIRKVSGVQELTCHVCRHTFVTRLCEKGVPAKAIAQIIGHSNSDYALDIYAKLEADELRKAIYVLEPNGLRSCGVMGSNVVLPSHLYSKLQQDAEQQKVSVDVLVTYLLSSAYALTVA